MENTTATYPGLLITGTQSIAVDLSYATQFSAYVKFKSQPAPSNEEEYEKISITISGEDHEFGACRFIPLTPLEEFNGSLVFIQDIIDIKALFIEKKLVTLHTLSQKILLVLAQKEKVKDFFKRYTADLIYDIKIYKHFFDDVDSRCAEAPGVVCNTVFEVIAGTEGKNFMDFFNRRLEELKSITSSFTKEEHELHGFYLRKQLWDIILCSEFMARTNIKPRGYAGDSEMMRMIYENSYTGDTTFSKILNKFSINVPAAQSVRNRRIKIPQILHKVQQEMKRQEGGLLRLMSVACGPAYELSDLFLSAADAEKFHCTLLDQDAEALGEAGENIAAVEKKFDCKINVSYLKDSVRTMIRTHDLHKIWGRFDFIYSMGLFDYLTQPVAKAVIEKIYSLLEPGGWLLVGNYHNSNKSRWFMEYWLDWVLYYRSEEDMINLLEDTDAINISIINEDAGCQVFLSAQKPLQ